ncbi:MFS transporter [Herbidospora mongoliensis]|uniref:MFS transporter n=1 Tax=Herbidospora mongoliensis TaxID=688067 RepID=UPI00082ABCCC|nr:MFS transporter [Herbidospora mongoliensis]
MKGVFAASFIGTSIEWYDYFIFGTAAALVFPRLFFTDSSPEAAMLASLSAFAVGFPVRPIGAAVVGHFGERIGRKSMLVLTLILTGTLPTYAAIGIGAPLLLVALRMIQGFGVAGEWGGALLISTGNATPRKPRLLGSLAQFGVLLSNLAFLAVAGLTLVLASTSVWILAIVVWARLSDRFGSKTLYIIGAVTAVIWPVPMFALVNTGNTGWRWSASWSRRSCRASWPARRAACSPSCSTRRCATAASRSRTASARPWPARPPRPSPPSTPPTAPPPRSRCSA